MPVVRFYALIGRLGLVKAGSSAGASSNRGHAKIRITREQGVFHENALRPFAGDRGDRVGFHDGRRNSRDGARLENAGARTFHAAARGALEFQHTTAGRLHI